jgi:hypothetical protein
MIYQEYSSIHVLNEVSSFCVQVLDNDPEVPVEVTYDLSSLINDAGIRERLNNLALDNGDPPLNTTTELQYLVDKYLEDYNSTTMSFDSATGLLTVPYDVLIAGDLRLASTLFFQSNVDFFIGFFLVVRERALNITLFANYTGQLNVNLVGTADPPTVFVNDAIGLSGERINVSIGGNLTDNDAALGRPSSETLYFIVTEVSSVNMPFDYKVRLTVVLVLV